jgi:hypothetical protein
VKIYAAAYVYVNGNGNVGRVVLIVERRPNDYPTALGRICWDQSMVRSDIRMGMSFVRNALIMAERAELRTIPRVLLLRRMGTVTL